MHDEVHERTHAVLVVVIGGTLHKLGDGDARTEVLVERLLSRAKVDVDVDLDLQARVSAFVIREPGKEEEPTLSPSSF